MFNRAGYGRWPLMVGAMVVSLLSGVSGLVERLIVAYHGETKPLTWFWAMVWVSFVLSCCALWIIEHKALVKEQGLNRLPQLKGRFHQVYIELGDAHSEGNGEIIVTCQLSLRNERPIATSVDAFSLRAIVGREYLGTQVSGRGFAYLPHNESDRTLLMCGRSIKHRFQMDTNKGK